MKVIVYTSHDRHREDIVEVYHYSDTNLQCVKLKMLQNWQGTESKWGQLGDCFSEGGKQYGYNEDYYDSYGIVDVLRIGG